MTNLRSAILLAGLLTALCIPARAPAANSQQERMKTCAAEAKSQSLSGSARQDYMKRCLGGHESSSGRALNSQQQKMKTCSAEAKSKGLAGAERKQYMSRCLK